LKNVCKVIEQKTENMMYRRHSLAFTEASKAVAATTEKKREVA
jgi:hypothetical protein